MKFSIVSIGAAFLLTGCYSIQGSERILDRSGYITDEAKVENSQVFAKDFEKAYTNRLNGGNANSATIDRMLSSGFTHIYSYCDNYFDVMSAKQRKSRITRNLITPISSIMTGVLAFQNFENNTSSKEDLLAIIGLATSAVNSGLDIYDEHMLFGAENVGAVEELTKEALSVHSSAVLDKKSITYDAAIRDLLDNQSYCSPQFILMFTRESIKEGNVIAITGDSSQKSLDSPNSRIELKIRSSGQVQTGDKDKGDDEGVGDVEGDGDEPALNYSAK